MKWDFGVHRSERTMLSCWELSGRISYSVPWSSTTWFVCATSDRHSWTGLSETNRSSFDGFFLKSVTSSAYFKLSKRRIRKKAHEDVFNSLSDAMHIATCGPRRKSAQDKYRHRQFHNIVQWRENYVCQKAESEAICSRGVQGLCPPDAQRTSADV